MIVCTHCGFKNDDGARFCGGCQEYLDWSGQELEELPDSETGADEPEVSAPVEPDQSTVPDNVPSVQAEAVARAEREAALAAEARRQADAEAQREAEATAKAQREARRAEEARSQAEARAVAEAAEVERLRHELEAAQAARIEAEETLERETAAAAERGAESERQHKALAAGAAAEATRLAEEAERAREQAESQLQAEREAAEQARVALERAEAEREAAETRAHAEAEAAAEAARKAAEAEEARVAAEAKAAEEAAAAERARRAAALVARPKASPSKRPVAAKPQSVSPAAPESSAPKAVKPATPKTRRAPRVKEEPSRRLRPGDLVCGQCGEGNPPDRNFCSRCGDSLSEAAPVAQPWWKRLLRRNPKVYAAGERRGRRVSSEPTNGGRKRGLLSRGRGVKRRIFGPLGRVTKVLAYVALGASAVGLTLSPSLRAPFTNWGGNVLDNIRGVITPEYEEVRLGPGVTVSATSELPDHPAAEMIDEDPRTWWSASDGGIGATITITFPNRQDIDLILFVPGPGEESLYAAHALPRRLRVDLNNGSEPRTFELAQERDYTNPSYNQNHQVPGEGVTEVTITIESVYPGEVLSISEVQFRRKK